MKKNVLCFLCILGLLSIVYVGSGYASSTDRHYLSKEQVQTLDSCRKLAGNDLFELEYKADYKLDAFIRNISAKKLEYGQDMRKALQETVVPGSQLAPTERLSNATPGCSSVVAQDKHTGAWLLGRNYDLDVNSNGTTVVIHTAPRNGYKSVGVADMAQFGLSTNRFEKDRELLLYAPYVTMDGVNEKGFAISIMVLGQARVVQNDSKKESLPSSLLVRYLLDKADSVKSAITLLEKLNLKPDYLLNTRQIQDFVGDRIAFHWALTDASGDRAVIEYVNGRINVIKNPVHVAYDEANYNIAISRPERAKPYLISTNFYLSKEIHTNVVDPDSGLWRYATLEKKLEANARPDKNELVAMMRSAKFLLNDFDMKMGLKRENKDPGDRKNWEWMTIWTGIFDTREKSLKLFYKEDYAQEYNFVIQ